MPIHAAGRVAAGHACFVIFHVLTSAVAHPIRLIVDARGPTPDMSRGLSAKERALLVDLGNQVSDIAETFRKLAWRLSRVRP